MNVKANLRREEVNEVAKRPESRRIKKTRRLEEKLMHAQSNPTAVQEIECFRLRVSSYQTIYGTYKSSSRNALVEYRYLI